MAVNDTDRELQLFFDSHLPDVDQRAFVSRLRERAASGRGHGRRAVVLVSVAAILVAALAIASLGSAAMDNEECWVYQAMLRALGPAYIEHQARI